MSDEYNEEHQRKGKTDYEFLKDRVRNYFTPISTYFEIKKMLDNGEILEDKKEGIRKIFHRCEKQCYLEVDKILKLIEGN
jgi:hypothetical protein